jgi:hypothetical protein
MQFDPDEIARLSPAARVEVQDFYARKFLAEREAPQPDRRAPRQQQISHPDEVLATTEPAPAQVPAEARPAWPRVWFRNDSSRPTSFPHQWPAPLRARRPVHVVSRTSPK